MHISVSYIIVILWQNVWICVLLKTRLSFLKYQLHYAHWHSSCFMVYLSHRIMRTLFDHPQRIHQCCCKMNTWRKMRQIAWSKYRKIDSLQNSTQIDRHVPLILPSMIKSTFLFPRVTGTNIYFISFHTTLTLSRSFLITSVSVESANKDFGVKPLQICT